MNLLVKMQFGSHVYGTNVPTSDTDFKAVYLPTANDILLGRVKQTVHQSTKEDRMAKNNAGDVDFETFSVQKYLQLLMEGQTVALDMLFTPSEFYIQSPDPIWHVIQENKHHFMSKQMKSFVGYCQTQAAKYGIKGSRIAAVRKFLDLTASFAPDKKLFHHWDDFYVPFAKQTEHCQVMGLKNPHGIIEPFLEVCGRKVASHSTVKYAREIFQRVFDQYGHRARLAETNDGIDWKALMHAVRVSREAVELLDSGKITFPRPERELLLQIRKGELAYPVVAEIIEQGLETVENAASMSRLSDKPNYALAEAIVLEAHKNEVRRTT